MLIAPPLTITVYFDFVCPWCWIGHRHLAEAIRRFRRTASEQPVVTRWQGLPLLPDIPATGMPYQRFYEHRLGGKAAVDSRRQQVIVAGQAAGLEFHFAAIERMPNTALAHQLFRHAQQNADEQCVALLFERLFAGFFLEGRDIGHLDTLLAIASECGLDDAQAQRAMAAGAVRQPESALLSGVPSFHFGRGLSISGAQPPETLLGLLQRSRTFSADMQGIAP